VTTESQTSPWRIGKYEVLAHLARGGMAVVYLAIEQGKHGLQRPVVIKQILPQHTEDASFRRMLFQEARIAARINHPNVVQILELGPHDPPFIAMEFICGINFRELTRRCAQREVSIPPGVAMGLVMQACAGAHAAHDLKDPSGSEANLVHRDLTPHNLMLNDAGFVKVVDFGVAKADFNLEQTRTGVLKGKVSYMSPEQLMQESIDRRSDVFALGCVLWELLHGASPFRKDNEITTMHAILSAKLPDVPLDKVPKEVHKATVQALRLSLKKRYQSAEEMRLALAEVGTRLGLDTSVDGVRAFSRAMLGELIDKRREYVDDLVAGWVLKQQAAVAEGEVDTETELGTRTTEMVGAPVLGDPPGREPTSVVPSKVLPIGGPPPGLESLADYEPPKKKSTSTETVKRRYPERFDLRLVGLGAAMLVVLGILVWGGSPGTDPLVSVPDPTTAVGPEDVEPIGDRMRIAVASTFESSQLKRDLEPLRNHLQTTLKRPIEWVFASNYDGTAELLLSGAVPFASLTPALYIRTHDMDPAVQLVAAKQHGGTTASDAVFLVRADLMVEAPLELKGKRICYTDALSTTGYLLPRTWLRRQGIRPDKDFSKVVMSGNHMDLIRDMSLGICDVGGTFRDALDRARMAEVDVAALRVMAITGRTPHDAICAGPSAEAGEVSRMRAALLGFEPPPAGPGDVEQLTGFGQVDDSTYDSLRRALE
jgi:serine/threonine-protein kinase